MGILLFGCTHQYGISTWLGMSNMLLSPRKKIHVVVYGDDFSALGEAEDLMRYEDNMKKYFEVGDLQRLCAQ